jgi:lycopene beta-cyclase
MHFRGWEIETPQPRFDPRAATFLDFRTPQQGSMRFFYVLPFSEQRALVEYTLFSTTALHHDEYALALTAYLKNAWKIADYHIAHEEGGIIPITDQPYPRRMGQHVMTIGTKAGRIKPTTGFAFMRIQDDSAAIVQSLVKHDQPFDVRPDSRRYRRYDALLLEIMERHGEEINSIFTTLFRRNPIDRVLRFLDEAGSPLENLQLIATMPPRRFLQALAQLAVR